MDDSVEEFAEASEEESVEKSSESPAENSVDTSVEIPVEDPVETSAETKVEDPVEISSEATADDEELPGDPSPEENPLELELNNALKEVEKFKDMAIRAEAEMQNVRRRAERDVENAHKYGLERILTNLLPVIDGLEKALESAPEEDDPVIDGVRLTFKLVQNVLEKESVEVIDPLGEPFNPNEHEAMSVVENPDMEPNSVCLVIQKGYKLNQRLVRPAMVMVTKAPLEQDQDP
ncbi:MAG: nucleotide exchange factor GrpE [Gammaproteobacteria bacterium]|nr:nucleotide exchange factor GrpE [Gammaproteobacteria bacterium]